MNQRFQASLANDPDLMLTINLANVLIITVRIMFNNFYNYY